MNISNNKYSQALWDVYHSGRMPVIPDINSRSPGEGDLLRERNPVSLARALAEAGAPVLSVVTESSYFGGSPEMLAQIVQATSLPILRKDFIKRPDQLQESADLGASAVLLIAAILDKAQLYDLIEASCLLGLEPLVEIHSPEEIRLVNELKLSMMGINNRNIVQLEMDDGNVSTTEELAALINPHTLVISESSIASYSDAERAQAAGAHAVLVGTAILKADDPSAMYRHLCQTRG